MEKNRYLNQLLDVIRVLRGSETELAKKHLIAYETNHTANNRKMFQLYKYIIINNIRDYDQLKKRLSPDSTDDSFNKLIRRTTDRIQESLIIDVNIRRKGAYSEIFRMKFFIRKLLIQGQILIGRGLIERPQSIVNTSIRYAKKYELYDELLEALYFNQVLMYRTKGFAAFAKLEEELDYYENCRLLLKKTKKIQGLFEASIARKSNRGQVAKSIKKQVVKLSDYYKKTNSTNILSYYYLLNIEIYKSEGYISEAVKNIRLLIELLKESPAVFSTTRIAHLHSELAESEYSQLKFNVVLEEVKEALRWIGSKNSLYVSTSLVGIDAQILLKEPESAIELIRKLKAVEAAKKIPFYKARISYQEAIVFFYSEDFKKALSLLSERSEIEKDKEGWNIWIRIMRILCSIELLKLNMIDYDVESFRKYIQRIDKQYNVRERDKLVLKILMELDRQDYDFEVVAQKRESELMKLKSTDRKFAWNPDSPEMILFHDWFDSKKNKTSYEPNFKIYSEVWSKTKKEKKTSK